MPACLNHPDRETHYLCHKKNIHLCEACLVCSDPELYCKFRSSCIIWFMTKKIAGLGAGTKKIMTT
jgi:hypothetical protein